MNKMMAVGFDFEEKFERALNAINVEIEFLKLRGEKTKVYQLQLTEEQYQQILKLSYVISTVDTPMFYPS